MTYKQEEIDMVADDMKVILSKFEMTLLKAMDDISAARRDLITPEAFATLVRVDADIKSVKIQPILDTLEGIIENQ